MEGIVESARKSLARKSCFVSINETYRLRRLLKVKEVALDDKFTFCVVGGDIKVIHGDYSKQELFKRSGNWAVIRPKYLPKFKTGIVAKCKFDPNGRMLLDDALSAGFNSKKQWLSLYYLLINSLQLQIVADGGKTYVQFLDEAFVDIPNQIIKSHIKEQTLDDLSCSCLVSFLKHFTSPADAGALQQFYVSRLDLHFFAKYNDIFKAYCAKVSLVDANVDSNTVGRTINARGERRGFASYDWDDIFSDGDGNGSDDDMDDADDDGSAMLFPSRIEKQVHHYYVHIEFDDDADDDINVYWKLSRDIPGVKIIDSLIDSTIIEGRTKIRIPLQSERKLLKSELEHLLVMTGQHGSTDQTALFNGTKELKFDATPTKERTYNGRFARKLYKDVSISLQEHEYIFTVFVRNQCKYDIVISWDLEDNGNRMKLVDNDAGNCQYIIKSNCHQCTFEIKLTSKHKLSALQIAKYLTVKGFTSDGNVPILLNGSYEARLGEFESTLRTSMKVYNYNFTVRVENKTNFQVTIFWHLEDNGDKVELEGVFNSGQIVIGQKTDQYTFQINMTSKHQLDDIQVQGKLLLKGSTSDHQIRVLLNGSYETKLNDFDSTLIVTMKEYNYTVRAILENTLEHDIRILSKMVRRETRYGLRILPRDIIVPALNTQLVTVQLKSFMEIITDEEVVLISPVNCYFDYDKTEIRLSLDQDNIAEKFKLTLSAEETIKQYEKQLEEFKKVNDRKDKLQKELVELEKSITKRAATLRAFKSRHCSLCKPRK